MLTQPTPAENPLPVIRLLQTYVREDRSGPAEITAERASQRVAATARVEALLTPSALRVLPLPTRAALFRRVLAATQGAIRLRERARMKQALLYTRLRHVALALGSRLVDAGVLAERDDVFFVTTDEALALAEGLGAHDVRALVTARRAAFRAAHALAPPDRFVLARGETWRPSDASDAADAAQGEALRGVGACGGKARGRAAVLLDVADADGLADGAILVTRQTDPGWAAVFFLVKGLVVERGGMLSHGAIIAREYGIPAVVGVRDATRLIRDGDDVRVDGNAGRVELARA
jgi:pyruvate,water dikinase